MAKLRKGCSYRSIERPNTRKSKYNKLSYVKSSPVCKVVRFDVGNLSKAFPIRVDLLVDRALQIRHNALEAARQTSARHLEKNLGKLGFRLKVRTYPHHILRENPLASGAGADRMSTGMQKSFGKPIGLAAQLRKNQPIFSVYIDSNAQLPVAKRALEKANHKLPCGGTIVIGTQSKQ
jgi:large subunit ribosomal protein L10e